MKKFIWFVILVLVVVLIWWMMSSNKTEAPTTDTTPTAVQSDQDEVNAELEGMSDVNLDSEFSDIDKDAAQL